jgi:hypothetical protein
MWHNGHSSFWASPIAYRRFLMYTMPWITQYQASVVPSVTGVAQRLFHNLRQFVSFYVFSIRISLPFSVPCQRVTMTPYVCLLYAFLFPSGLRGDTYAESNAGCCRYSNRACLLLLEGLALDRKKFHFRNLSAVDDPSFLPISFTRYICKALRGAVNKFPDWWRKTQKT